MILDRHSVPIAAAVGAATLALIAWINFSVGQDEQGGLGPFLLTAGIAVAVWAVLFGWYAPRAQQPARAGLVAGVLGLVSVAAFWSGLPLLLGAAAVLFGARGRDESPGAGTAAVALGALAVVLAVAATLFDRLG